MKNSKPIRILVVDDHFMVRMGLSASLNVEPDMEVVAEAGNGDAAIEAYRKHRPSLVMMDLRLAGNERYRVHGCDPSRISGCAHPDAFHALRGRGDLSSYAGRRQGIHRQEHHPRRTPACRPRGSPRPTVCRPTRGVALGERRSHRSLSAREVEVLRMVAKGFGNKEIATALNIAEVTVKLHVSHVLEKLSVKDRTQAATVALQRGIISLD